MARPTKLTVDYFPHYIKFGKTIMILESRYGNDGYAFWFKLLEILAGSEGHYYEYINTFEQEFLHAKTKVTGVVALEILNLLADMDAINNELWHQDKIIWSDNFIANISGAYERRKVDVPQKPELSMVNVNINDSKQANIEQSADIKPQIRLDKIKLDKIRLEENNIVDKSPSTEPPIYKYDSENTYYKMAVYFRGKMLEYDSSRKVPNEEVKTLQTWADILRKTIELDKRTVDNFKVIMRFLDHDDFWQGVIMSPKGLRKNWDKVMAQTKRGSSKNNNNGGIERVKQLREKRLQQQTQ